VPLLLTPTQIRLSSQAGNPVAMSIDKAGASVKNIRVCMLTYSFYENDGRVKRYAETLARRGDQVDIVALKKPGQTDFDIINEVNVYRIQTRTPDEKGKLSYFVKLFRFLIHSALFLSKRHLVSPYQIIHVHSIPDFEVFAAILPKFSGAKIILDIHDIVPELYVSKFRSKDNGLLFKALVKMEKCACAFSDHVIASNHIWEEKLLARSVARKKCTTILNYPDPHIFHEKSRTRADNKFIMIYPGTLNWHQGLDIAINAFQKIAPKLPQAEFHIYGRGSELESLKALVDSKGLRDRVLFWDPKPIEYISEMIANADLGIIPKRNDPFGGEAFSTKSLEFMSMGMPVVMSATKIDKYYFNDSVTRFFEPDDADALAMAMYELASDEKIRNTYAKTALKFVENFSWGVKQQDYLGIVDRLCLCKESRK
jgi:glycosyltransferase involved in cell wall biosynthesis